MSFTLILLAILLAPFLLLRCFCTSNNLTERLPKTRQVDLFQVLPVKMMPDLSRERVDLNIKLVDLLQRNNQYPQQLPRGRQGQTPNDSQNKRGPLGTAAEHEGRV
jgi:hypothetical protein